MAFTNDSWQRIGPILEAIERHPFLAALADGSLSGARFHYYMAQDALYLSAYSRMLALAASQAQDADDTRFWSNSSLTALLAERQLHAQFVQDLGAAAMAPTCAAYTAHLAAVGAEGSYAALAAALLPCFSIYAHVGALLARRAGDADALARHPYGAWIATYASDDFAEPARHACAIVDRAVKDAGAHGAARAAHAYQRSARYEWMFWDAAWRMEEWPI